MLKQGIKGIAGLALIASMGLSLAACGGDVDGATVNGEMSGEITVV